VRKSKVGDFLRGADPVSPVVFHTEEYRMRLRDFHRSVVGKNRKKEGERRENMETAVWLVQLGETHFFF
jgi:hypothetical protein